MALLRRQHGGGRDFLLENKNNVSRMETNGRCLAAANARRVPLWRPVVLHYQEKRRPHSQTLQRRTRQWHPPAEAPDLRSGLTRPHNLKDDHRRRLPPPSQDELAQRQAKSRERDRLQGGWVDPRYEQQQQRQGRRKCCQECHCHHPPVAQQEQVPKQPDVPPQQEQDPERMSQISRQSRNSKKSHSRTQENPNPEAPLSARSNGSAKTIKAQRSNSQESLRSNATLKSNSTVTSSATSKSSQVSRKTRLSHLSQMEVMAPPQHQTQNQTHSHNQTSKDRPEKALGKQEPPAYEGYAPLSQTEKQAALGEAHFKYGKLIEEYNHLPVSEPTLRVRSRKMAIERELDELDYAINMFDQPHLDMYYKR